ncbi:MAG TPA: tetratricopeptide repeat protein [Chthonomonadaceae bacterium]|nr:tetratricopeptide repeat protein [Chthonomonadaceae bacterium]
MLSGPWRIQMLGGLSLCQENRIITRFQTEKTGALLALLALFPHGYDSRERITGILWPEAPESDPGRNLRVALTSLRHQLEPVGVLKGSVLFADRNSVRLNREAVQTDVAEFEAALQQAQSAPDPVAQALHLTRALALYRGELLPGSYLDPILAARERLSNAYRKACLDLVALRRQSGALHLALDAALRAQETDPLDASGVREVLLLYAALGQPSEALQHYHAYARRLREELGEAPEPDLSALAHEVGSLPSEEILQPAPQPTRLDPDPETAPPIPIPRLPITLNPFFGREEEMQRLLALLQPASPAVPHSPSLLVTLMGLGGTGKTRLATEVARQSLERFRNAVWFVPLADLTDPTLILEAIRTAMQLKRTSDAAPLEQVVAALQRPALLVLDNFEHLVAGGANLVQMLRQRCPLLTLLITSRRRLSLPGERIFPLSPLPLPQENEAPEHLAQNASIQLYLDRARAVRADFELTRSNASIVAQICRKLEGVPLAIELAAARAAAFTPVQILNLLTERFAVLQSRRRGREARHASLWAAMDWSYGMLAPELQRLFVQLSVFRGGYSLEAAEAVCICYEETFSEEQSRRLQRTAECLAQLQSCSLVLAQDGGEEFRYHLLETVREFAAAQLTRPQQEALSLRHITYYVHLAESLDGQLRGPQSRERLDRLEREHDNFRSALTWSLDGGATAGEGEEQSGSADEGAPRKLVYVEWGLRLTGALWNFWDRRNYHREGLAWLERALMLGREMQAPLRIKALTGAGNLAFRLADHITALRFFQECLALRQEIGDKRGVASSLGSLGNVAKNEGDYPLARRRLEESLALFEELDDRRGIALTLGNLARVSSAEREDATAERLYLQSQAMFREMQSYQDLILSLNNLASMLLRVERTGEVPRLLREAISLAREQDSKRGQAHSLTNTVALALHLGLLERAAVLAGAEDAFRRQIDFSLAPRDDAAEEHTATLASIREALGPTRYQEAFSHGEQMTWEESLEYALDTFALAPPG